MLCVTRRATGFIPEIPFKNPFKGIPGFLNTLYYFYKQNINSYVKSRMITSEKFRVKIWNKQSYRKNYLIKSCWLSTFRFLCSRQFWNIPKDMKISESQSTLKNKQKKYCDKIFYATSDLWNIIRT